MRAYDDVPYTVEELTEILNYFRVPDTIRKWSQYVEERTGYKFLKGVNENHIVYKEGTDEPREDFYYTDEEVKKFERFVELLEEKVEFNTSLYRAFLSSEDYALMKRVNFRYNTYKKMKFGKED
ncbi:hypothetical protein SAMN02745116_01406 [Pilibacter termitis]|uniref:Uncharacterized protein n=1 Tax=Pilibacter termitis TaxID=263852 RepID=A0A1T4NFZ2_9ENTE|nr:hypothetical protein [Pilibacter termitis]SJZ77698.1 hypothetical protein SAMN02745116_01406 [Pilibacter termitis]